MNGAVRAFRSFCLPGARGSRRALGVLASVCLLTGCTTAPRMLVPDEQHVIDRALVEYPAGFELRRYATGFTAPSAVTFDADGSLFVAEGERDDEPQICAFPPTAETRPSSIRTMAT